MCSKVSQGSGCKTALEEGPGVGVPPLLMSQERDLSPKCAVSEDMASGLSSSGAWAARGANTSRVRNPGYGMQRTGTYTSLGSLGVESGFDSSDEREENLQDPEDGSGTEDTDLPQVPDPAEHNGRDSICESEMRPRKDKAVFEILKDALGAKNGSATKGTELPQLPDPAGHRQGEAASLLGQSESQPRNGTGEKCQDGSAMGVTCRKTIREYLGEWFKSHPVLTLAVLIVLLIVAVVLAVSLAAVSGRNHPLLQACPHDWVGYNGICYFLSRDHLSWDQAKARCSELEASLAVPKDEEMEFLFRLIKNNDYWLGLHRQGQRLQWVDGSNFSSSIEVSGEGDCVFLGNGEFWRGSCSNLRPFICSRPLTRL